MKKTDQILIKKLCLLIAAIFMASAIWAQQKSITGTVTDDDGQPLPGVAVVVEGTTVGTVTNVDGVYTLDGIPADAVNLSFSFVGMKTVLVAIADQTTIDLQMEAETIGLEEVVAVGYGTQKKVNMTGSVTSVQAEELVKAPVSNVSEILNGRAPGLFTKTPDAVSRARCPHRRT